MFSSHHTHKALGYAGLIPFIALALLSISDTSNTLWLLLFASYSCLIASFLAGTHWGLALHHGKSAAAALIISNIICLLAWFGFIVFILGNTALGIIVLSISYLLLLLLDFKREESVQGYKQLRANLSIIVILSHLAVLVARTYL